MNKSMQAALVLSVMLVATLAVAIVADGMDADSEIPDDAANPADAGTICTVGGTEYTSLIDAINESTSGDTILIEEDFTQSASVTIDKELTIDLNGQTIASGVSNETLITVTAGGNLTIRDGTNTDGGFYTTNHGYLIDTKTDSDLIIESGIFHMKDMTECDIIGIQGDGTINGGTFIYEGSHKMDGCVLRVYNGGQVIINDIDIDSDKQAIVLRSDPSQSRSTTLTFNNGTIDSCYYAFSVFGHGYDDEDNNNNAVLTVIDADVTVRDSENPDESESAVFGTNASGGTNAGHTINIEGGLFTGNTGCYFPSYGLYNITGGTFETSMYGIRIAAGILNISDDAEITTNIISESIPLENENKPTGTLGALTIGKISSEYVGDIVVNISGGSLNNALGNAITVYDDTMGTTELEGKVISINLTGGTVTGNVEFISADDGDSDSNALSLTLDGGNIDGNLKLEAGMQSTIKLTSGTISGNVDGVNVEATGTVTYPDGTTTNYYNSFVLPGAPEDIDGYTFLGYSLRPDATSTDYLPNRTVTASGDVIVYEVWESDEPFIPFPDDDDEYVPIPPVVYDDSGDDDTVTIVACAAAAVVAAILAVFLIVERKH